MAAGNQIAAFTPTREAATLVTFQARLEIRNKQLVWVFDPDTDTDIILDSIVADLYAATTGFRINLCYGVDLPVATGNVSWAATVERMQASTALNLHSADNWATEVTLAAEACPAAGGQVKYSGNIDLPKVASLNSLAAGERYRLRIRRYGSAAADTCKAAALLLAVRVVEY